MTKPLSLKKSLELMQGRSLPGNQKSRLVKMFTNASPDGFAFYIVPGGYITPDTAASILNRPDIKPMEDGLWKGTDQSWGYL